MWQAFLFSLETMGSILLVKLEILISPQDST